MIDRTTYRPATDADVDFLRTIVAEAVNWRESPDFDSSILESPELAHCVDDGQRGASTLGSSLVLRRPAHTSLWDAGV